LGSLTKAQIREKLAKVLKAKEECITIFGMKTKFGGGRSSAFALIYDSLDEKKKYDSKTALRRVSTFFYSWLGDEGLGRRVLSNVACLCLLFLKFNSNYLPKPLANIRLLPYFRTASWLDPSTAASPRRRSRRDRTRSTEPPSPRSPPASRRSERVLFPERWCLQPV